MTSTPTPSWVHVYTHPVSEPNNRAAASLLQCRVTCQHSSVWFSAEFGGVIPAPLESSLPILPLCCVIPPGTTPSPPVPSGMEHYTHSVALMQATRLNEKSVHHAHSFLLCLSMTVSSSLDILLCSHPVSTSHNPRYVSSFP